MTHTQGVGSAERTSCACSKCKQACQRVPGWFLPGEAEKAAALKGMPLRKFFKKYLGVQWAKPSKDSQEVFLLAPAITTMKRGQEYPADPRGTCIFFKNGLCDIHEAAPFECRIYLHTDTHEEVMARRQIVYEAWQEHQDQIKALLGRQYPRSSVLVDEFGAWE